MLLHIISLIVILLKSTRCSLVFDRMSQKSPQVQNYCPKTKYCKEGTHVMCMYYDPNYEIGPGCYNFVNTEITPKLMARIVDIVNQIRMRVASGDETGFNEEPFPKSYGMMRMSWDNELATFAQVLANQCFGGKEDMCRSTDKFPNPSQGSAIVQFKYPDWGYLVNDTHPPEGLGEDKLEYAIDRFFRAAYDLKKTVTRDMIVNCPEIHKLPNVKSRFYLNLIRGPATHIGCGISAYTRYNSHNQKSSYYNAVEIICNFSEGPQPTQSIYMINPPIPGTGFSENCGCPQLYQETAGCLCEENIITYESANPAQPQQWGQNEMQDNTMLQPMVDQQSYNLPNLQVGMGQPQPILNNPVPDLDPTVKLIPPKKLIERQQWSNPKQVWTATLNPTAAAMLLQKKAARQPFCIDTLGKCEKGSVLLPIFSGHENYGSINYLRTVNGSQIPLSRAQELAAITNFAKNLIVEVPKLSSESLKINGRDIKKSLNSYLLSLLDNLELEVKKRKLDPKTQEVFDSKMRSIYGNAQENYVQPTKTTTEIMNIDEQFNNVLSNYVKPKSDVESIRKGLGLNITANAATMANETTDNIYNSDEKLFEKLFVKNINNRKVTTNLDADQQSTHYIDQSTEHEALRTKDYDYKYGKTIQVPKIEATTVHVGNCINVKGQLIESKAFQDVKFPEDDLTFEDDNNKEVQFTLQVGNCVNVKGQLTKNERTLIEMVIGKDKNKDQWPENDPTLHIKEKHIDTEKGNLRKNNSKVFKLRSTYFNDEDQFIENKPTPLKEYSSKEETRLNESLFQDGILNHYYNNTADLRNNNYKIRNRASYYEINNNLDQQDDNLRINHKDENQFKDNEPTPRKVDYDKGDKNHLKKSSFQDGKLIRHYNNTAEISYNNDQTRDKASNHEVNDNLNHQNDNFRIYHKDENQSKDDELTPHKVGNATAYENHLKKSLFQDGILFHYDNNTANQKNNNDQIRNKASNYEVNDNLNHQNDNLRISLRDENQFKDYEPTPLIVDIDKGNKTHLKESSFQDGILIRYFNNTPDLRNIRNKASNLEVNDNLNDQNDNLRINHKDENQFKDNEPTLHTVENDKEDNKKKKSSFQNEKFIRYYNNTTDLSNNNDQIRDKAFNHELNDNLNPQNDNFRIHHKDESQFKDDELTPHKVGNAKANESHLKKSLFQDGILLHHDNNTANLRNNHDQIRNKTSNHDLSDNLYYRNDNLSSNYKGENQFKDNEPTPLVVGNGNKDENHQNPLKLDTGKEDENHLKEFLLQNPLKLDNGKEDKNPLKESLFHNPIKLDNGTEAENHFKKSLFQNPHKLDNGKEGENHLKKFLFQNPPEQDTGKKDENHLKELLLQNSLNLDNHKESENHLKESLFQNPHKLDNGKEDENHLKEFLFQNSPKVDTFKEDENYLKESFYHNLMKVDDGKEDENQLKQSLFRNPIKLDNGKEAENYLKESLFQNGILIRDYNNTVDLKNDNDQIHNRASNQHVNVNLVHQNDNLNKQKYLNEFQQRTEEFTSQLEQKTEESTTQLEQKIEETTPQFQNLDFLEKTISGNKLRSSILEKIDEMLAPSGDEEDVIVTRRHNRKNAISKFSNNIRSDPPKKSKKIFVIYFPTDSR